MPDRSDYRADALARGNEAIEPPQLLAPDEEAVVAYWRQGTVAALLSIWRDPDDPDEPFQQEIELYEEIDGGWVDLGGGGKEWPVLYGDRPTGQPYETGLSAGSPTSGGDYVWISSGIAPRSVRVVEVGGPEGLDAVEADSVTGAFLFRRRDPHDLPSLRSSDA
jgi:hypothetical protein